MRKTTTISFDSHFHSLTTPFFDLPKVQNTMGGYTPNISSRLPRSRAFIGKGFSISSKELDGCNDYIHSFETISRAPLFDAWDSFLQSSSTIKRSSEENENFFDKSFSSNHIRRASRRTLPLPCPAPAVSDLQDDATRTQYAQQRYDMATWAMYHRITSAKRRKSHVPHRNEAPINALSHRSEYGDEIQLNSGFTIENNSVKNLKQASDLPDYNEDIFTMDF